PSVSPNLTWTVVGCDRFVRFPEEMNWHQGRALCQSHGLDLYRPCNLTAVAQYLDDNFRDTWYWLGAQGNGTHQVWFSGEVLISAEPWYSNYFQRVGTTYCLDVITHSGLYRKGTILAATSCSRRTNIDVLCG
ncbi:unnamed protein product, partial [Meganyctiphanes norvegica]